MISQLIIGTLTISILHALIPSHWIPILAFEKKFTWTRQQTLRITIISALAHALSTVLLGIAIGILSFKINEHFETISKIIFSAMLIIMGCVFIFRHHKHNHFHLHNEGELQKMDSRKIITVLVIGMFLSPCLEIEGYFLLAGSVGIKYVLMVGAIYIIISVTGIVMWMMFAKEILKKINSHKIEHNAGLISGFVLIISGVINFFIS